MSDSEEDTDKSIFTELAVSTISMNGSISGANIDDKRDIQKMTYTTRICEISNNFGRHISPEYEEYQQSRDKSTAANKASAGKRHQASQITFVIKNAAGTQYYKIKVFKKGAVQIPGVTSSNYNDIAESLNVLIKYLRVFYKNPSIKMTLLFTTMKNYICALVYDKMRINITRLKSEIEKYKRENNFRERVRRIMETLGFPRKQIKDDDDSDSGSDSDGDSIKIPKPIKEDGIKRYSKEDLAELVVIACGTSEERIAEVKKDADKNVSCLFVRFYRASDRQRKATKEKEPKRTTIKIMLSGKINIEGGNDQKEAEELRTWLSDFIIKRKSLILKHIDSIADDVSDSDSGESIYADFDPPKKIKAK